MDSKLKALKVVDLKDILQKASVPLPSKANKADLIAAIQANPAAVAEFEKRNGGGSSKPPAPAPEAGASTLQASVPNAVAAGAPSLSSKAASKRATTAHASAVASEPSVPASSATPEADTPAPDSKTDAAKSAEDEELRKRKARAARFGLPLVEKAADTPAAVNGRKKDTKAVPAKAAQPTEQDPEILKRRAARFGIRKDAASEKSNGKKRPAPAEVDPEELEKRRKRAERFGIPFTGEAKA
ncbi:hypothetical protein OE88DRAFT_1655027 [Heliocybe sulcata]|uniref:Uncharacterized protein n=1 Tax=Heliocybe sulcata TaxID=5364 RepID=A0A5C3ND69_9AGAM|nr:hypothetical protein OE88DRAFT_1655027 [Heliocybe sulcata]